MINKIVNKCAFCDQTADRECPIVGESICSSTCLELSLWADEVLSDEGDIYLEYIDKVRSYGKVELSLHSDEQVAKICQNCKYHWVEVDES